jgi:hypothetical protein
VTGATGLADLIQRQQIDDATAYEQQIQDQAAGDSHHLLAEAVTAAAALWVAAFGSSTAVGAGAALARILRQTGIAITDALSGLGARTWDALLAALPGARRLGRAQAAAVLRAAGQRTRKAALPRMRGSKAVVREATALEAYVADALDRARRLLAANPDRLADVLAAIGVARGAVNRVRSAIAWHVHRTVSRGAGDVATAQGLGRLWVAEATACLQCSAYSGQFAPAGEDFEGGLSFDPHQRGHGPDTVPGPPLHPHCRCRTVPWSVEWQIPLPRVLKARARASVDRRT